MESLTLKRTSHEEEICLQFWLTVHLNICRKHFGGLHLENTPEKLFLQIDVLEKDRLTF